MHTHQGFPTYTRGQVRQGEGAIGGLAYQREWEVLMGAQVAHALND
jgi:hypothetical protein